jgi:hypothetical protein
MAGKLVTICTPRVFDFTLVSSSGVSLDFVVKNNIDVSGWRSASLMVRTHVNSMATGAGNIRVFAQRESRSAQDPDILFVNTGEQLGQMIFYPGSNPFDAQFLETSTTTLGPMVRVVVRGTHTGTGALAATLSIDLCLKSS